MYLDSGIANQIKVDKNINVESDQAGPLYPRTFPESIAQIFKCLVDHAVLAPSGHNTQPWFFRQVDDHLDLYADRSRGLPVVDPLDRELTISCGAALDHLAVASRNHGYDLDVDLVPDSENPDLLARVHLGKEVAPSAADMSLFKAIPRRRTTRCKFENKLLTSEVRDQCQEAARHHGIELVLITDSTQRSEIADLVAEGDRIQFNDPAFRQELGNWVHSRRRKSRDGMSGTGFGMPDIFSPLGAFVIRTFDIGNGVAAGDRDKIVDGSPTLAVIASEGDTVTDWLVTGRALSQTLLTLTAAGANASYLNPPVEIETLRPRLKQLAKCDGVPQLLMRYGFGPDVEATIRRDVDEVLSVER